MSHFVLPGNEAFPAMDAAERPALFGTFQVVFFTLHIREPSIALAAYLIIRMAELYVSIERILAQVAFSAQIARAVLVVSRDMSVKFHQVRELHFADDAVPFILFEVEYLEAYFLVEFHSLIVDLVYVFGRIF